MRTSLRTLRTKYSSKPRRYKDARRAAVVKCRYGPNWPEQRRKALERDGYRCTKCGGKLGIAVHHIRKARLWVVDGKYDWEKGNDLNNLTTLCGKCHIVQDQHDNPAKRGFSYIQ